MCATAVTGCASSILTACAPRQIGFGHSHDMTVILVARSRDGGAQKILFSVGASPFIGTAARAGCRGWPATPTWPTIHIRDFLNRYDANGQDLYKTRNVGLIRSRSGRCLLERRRRKTLGATKAWPCRGSIVASEARAVRIRPAISNYETVYLHI